MWTEDQKARYARQWVLNAWSEGAQRKLADAHVLVIGAGGLGSPACYYLAAAGVGAIDLVDDDVVELSNLNRQTLHATKDVGRPKVESAAEKIEAFNPNCKVEKHQIRLSAKNAEKYFMRADVVLDCTDGFPNKYMLSDLAVKFEKPLVHAGLLAWSGQIFFIKPGEGPCLRCIFPNPPPADKYPTGATIGIFGAAAGLFGTLEATEAIKFIAGVGEILVGRMVTYDALSMQWHQMKISRDPKCPACGKHSWSEKKSR